MIQRGGQVVIHMLENVRQVTIQPLIQATIAPGTRVLTDEYDIYFRLPQWGMQILSAHYGFRVVSQEATPRGIRGVVFRDF